MVIKQCVLFCMSIGFLVNYPFEGTVEKKNHFNGSSSSRPGNYRQFRGVCMSIEGNWVSIKEQRQKYEDELKQLVERCKNMDDLSQLKDSPLNYRVFYEIQEFFNELKGFLKKRINPNLENKIGNRPLNAALYAENVEAVRILLQYRAALNYKQASIRSISPLVTAIHYIKTDKSLSIIKLLLQHGANPNHEEKNIEGKITNPLLEAVSGGLCSESLEKYRCAIIALLLQYGAKLRVEDIIPFMRECFNNAVIKEDKLFYKIKNPRLYKKIEQTFLRLSSVETLLYGKKPGNPFGCLSPELIELIIRHLGFMEFMELQKEQEEWEKVQEAIDALDVPQYIGVPWLKMGISF